MGKFIILTRTNGEYQFNLKAANGEIILTSQGYSTKAHCLHGIESVRHNAQDPTKFEVLNSKNNKPYFILRAANNEIIGTSQMYETSSACRKGMESVIINAPKATIEDQSSMAA